LFFGGYHILQWQSSKERVIVPRIEKRSQKVFIFKRTKAYLRWKGIWMKVALFSMPVLAILMYFLSVSYQQDNEFLENINETITGRLALGKTDILLRYGILFLIMVFIIYGTICYKHKEDTVLMLAVTLLAISCFIDHHMMEEAYNPLTYALFAKTGEILGKSDKCSLKSYFQN